MKKHWIYQFARDLRRNQTPAEAIAWNMLRNRNFHDLKFTRQFVIQHAVVLGSESFFIADFYCHAYKLIIEIDGPIHKYQKDYDELREEILIELGYQVLRFTNEAVLNDWEGVAKRIEEVLT